MCLEDWILFFSALLTIFHVLFLNSTVRKNVLKNSVNGFAPGYVEQLLLPPFSYPTLMRTGRICITEESAILAKHQVDPKSKGSHLKTYSDPADRDTTLFIDAEVDLRLVFHF